MAETTEMDEMPKIVESKQTEGLDGLAVETDDYFIINRNEHTYLYMVTVNILKAFLLPIFILTRLSKRYGVAVVLFDVDIYRLFCGVRRSFLCVIHKRFG
jgi:hypothetical protein